MTKVKTLSIPDELDLYLEESGLSPSALLQRSIREHMERAKDFEKDKSELLRRIAAIRVELDKRLNFINDKGLNDAYEQWAGLQER